MQSTSCALNDSALVPDRLLEQGKKLHTGVLQLPGASSFAGRTPFTLQQGNHLCLQADAVLQTGRRIGCVCPV